MARVKLARTKESFFVKIESKDAGTVRNYVTAINNLENFCMEQFGKLFAEYFEESKNDNTRIWCNIELIEPPKNTKLEKYALT